MIKFVMKKMRILIFLILGSLMFSCAISKKTIVGTYTSVCKLHAYPLLKLYLNEDGSFIYKRAYLDKKISGKWELKNDTLILKSRYFSTEFEKPMSPKIKYTSYKDRVDAFLIKREKLFVIDSTLNASKECFLIEVI